MIDVFKGFLPWILYSLFYSDNTKQFIIAVVAALAANFIIDRKDLKEKFILSWGTVIYFSLLLILTLLFHWHWLQTNSWVISNLALAVIVFTSAILKRPFTMQYAKRQVSDEYWQTPLFIQINYILTITWGCIFILTAAVNFLYIEDPKLNPVLYFILSNIGWVIGIYFNKVFPPFWRKYKLSKIKNKQPRVTQKAVSYFLEGNYAPWRSEDNFASLEIIGKIPADLNGVLLRNGPNPQFDPLGQYHWFEGDGMLHAIRLINGKASYDNRWVRTQRFQAEHRAGKSLFNTNFSGESDNDLTEISSNTANTNIIAYQKKLLALNEGASPVEIKLADLATIGDYTFDGQLKRRLTAHPRFDHHKKEFITYSYIGLDKKLFYYRLNNENQLIAQKEILWPYSSMIHDFINTENYVIFPIFPCTISIERMLRGETMYMWEGDRLTTFFIVTDKQGNEVMRAETDPCYVYHFGNAYENGDEIIIDAMIEKRTALMPDRNGKIDSDENTNACLGRWIINLKNKSIRKDYLDDTISEFPRFDERFNGYPYQHLYYCGQHQSHEFYDRIIHYDLKNNVKQEHHFQQDVPGEPVFVSRSEKEGDGYLLTVVYRTRENRSDVVILDATRIQEEPLAIIKIPHRIPFGFHGNFIRN